MYAYQLIGLASDEPEEVPGGTEEKDDGNAD